DFHFFGLDLALAGLERGRAECRGGRDEPVLLLPVEHLLAVGRDFESVDVVERLVELALLQIEFVQRGALRAVGNFDDVQRVRLARRQSDVVPVWRRQRQNALADVVEINCDLRRLFLITRFGAAGRRLRGVSLLLAFLRPVALSLRRPVFLLRGLLFGDFLFVAFGGERRGVGLLQDRDVDAARRAVRVAGHVEAEDARADVSAGGEVDILAALVEDRAERVTQSVGDLRALAVFERIDEDRVVPRLERLGVSQPAAGGRPARRQREAPAQGVNLDRLAFLYVDVPNVQPLVGISDLLAVGRPGRVVEE